MFLDKGRAMPLQLFDPCHHYTVAKKRARIKQPEYYHPEAMARARISEATYRPILFIVG